MRPYFLIYGGLWLEPRSVPEAYDFAKKAFAYSEKFQIPVVLRVTNILYDMGLMPAAWERSKEPVVEFDSLQRYPDRSPYVVHPSEAWRMEQELEEKTGTSENLSRHFTSTSRRSVLRRSSAERNATP